ncbi:hypothetical protein BDR26DRAFT_914199 [Obelidium mucronatum]|nr:hypothetical protein BDR26DRAFT_914199 [Obelidium mucronatum]
MDENNTNEDLELTADQIVQHFAEEIESQQQEEEDLTQDENAGLSAAHYRMIMKALNLTQKLCLQTLSGQAYLLSAIETKNQENTRNPLSWDALGTSLHLFVEKEARKNLFMNGAEAESVLELWISNKPDTEKAVLRLDEEGKIDEFFKLCVPKTLNLVRNKRNALADKTRSKIRHTQKIHPSVKLNLRGSNDATRFKAEFLQHSSVIAAKAALITNRATVESCHHGTNLLSGKLNKHETQFVFATTTQFLDGEGIGAEEDFKTIMSDYMANPCVDAGQTGAGIGNGLAGGRGRGLGAGRGIRLIGGRGRTGRVG